MGIIKSITIYGLQELESVIQYLSQVLDHTCVEKWSYEHQMLTLHMKNLRGIVHLERKLRERRAKLFFLAGQEDSSQTFAYKLAGKKGRKIKQEKFGRPDKKG